MKTLLDQLTSYLEAPEGTQLEFKEASKNYHFEKLVDYCVALANEGGGEIIFGVTDIRPRRIVGTAGGLMKGAAAGAALEAGLVGQVAVDLDQLMKKLEVVNEGVAHCGQSEVVRN